MSMQALRISTYEILTLIWIIRISLDCKAMRDTVEQLNIVLLASRLKYVNCLAARLGVECLVVLGAREQ